MARSKPAVARVGTEAQSPPTVLTAGSSYYARYWSGSEVMLVGGIWSGQSCRFGLLADAKACLEIVRDANVSSNCRFGGEIESSPLPPEVFPHCSAGPSQRVGSECGVCGKVITREDSVAFARGRRGEKTPGPKPVTQYKIRNRRGRGRPPAPKATGKTTPKTAKKKVSAKE